METRDYSDNPFTVNGFKGTWAISDHDLIPSSLNNFIRECFPNIERFKKIPLEDINRVLNEAWEGPGSLPKLEALAREMRDRRLAEGRTRKDPLGGEPVKTIDDYDGEEFEYALDLPAEPEE